MKVVKKAGTVIAGDFNTDAHGQYRRRATDSDPPYFRDMWKPKRDGRGLSCCQNADLSTRSARTRPVSTWCLAAAR